MTRRIVGTLLILLGFLGMAVCALGVVYVWRGMEQVTTVADDSLVLLSDTLDEIDHSLGVAGDTLGAATEAVDVLFTTTLDVSSTISSTKTTIDQIAGMTEDELPGSLEASLMALESVEETAAVIDRLLRTLEQLGVGSYDPEVPLDEAVAEAGRSLEPIPDSVRAMGSSLRQTSGSLEEVQAGILLMGNQMTVIGESITDADAAIGGLGESLAELQSRIDAARQNLVRPIRTVAWGATLLLIWIGLSQLAIVRWGIGMWQAPPSRAESPTDTAD